MNNISKLIIFKYKFALFLTDNEVEANNKVKDIY